MLETIRNVIQKYQLIPPQSTVLVGVSGGADSLALLHILYTLSSRMSFTIQAATLDHCLRGEESAADVRFVEFICREWGIPVTSGRANVRDLASEQQLSIETAARVARYDFLANTAGHVGASRIVVAHHANDQSETVLLRLLRGAGTHGLRGMSWLAPVPGHADLILVRPFLQITRAEIEAYCWENKLTPRQDSSNEDTTILRNHIRLDIFPALEKFNPRIQQLLTQLADIAAVEDDYLQAQLEAVTETALVTTGRISIQREVFRDLHSALQRRFITWAAEQLGKAESVDYRHVLEAVNLGLRGQLGAVALFGGGMRLRVDYEVLIVEAGDAPLSEAAYPLLQPNSEMQVQIPGVTVLDGWNLQVSSTSFGKNEPECRLAIPPEAIVTLRTRREGDRFAPLGMGGQHQKLNRWMINRKIPRAEREYLPLVCVNGEVAAIMIRGEWIVNEYFAVRNDSPRVIYLHYRRSGSTHNETLSDG